jgi:hypothetical protein
MSSFQPEAIDRMHLFAALLNVTLDHLDRYDSDGLLRAQRETSFVIRLLTMLRC